MPARRSSRIPVNKLVKAAQAAGIPVYPLPGASAVLAALTISRTPKREIFLRRLSAAEIGRA